MAKSKTKRRSFLKRQARRVSRMHCLDSLFMFLVFVVAVITSAYAPDEAVAFATVAAIAVGGWWTYTNFIRKRVSAPRAKVALSVTDFKVTEKKNVVHAVLTFENIGESLIKLNEFFVRFHLVLPADDRKVSDRFESATNETDFDVVENEKGRTCIEWPELTCREVKAEEKDKEGLVRVEPGETQTLYADAVIDSDIRLVRVYGYVHNSKTRDIGWDCETFHHVRSAKDYAEERKLRSEQKDRRTEEARGRTGEGASASSTSACSQEG